MLEDQVNVSFVNQLVLENKNKEENHERDIQHYFHSIIFKDETEYFFNNFDGDHVPLLEVNKFLTY